MRRAGIARVWIEVGLVIWRERWRWAHIVGFIPREANSVTSIRGGSARVMLDGLADSLTSVEGVWGSMGSWVSFITLSFF